MKWSLDYVQASNRLSHGQFFNLTDVHFLDWTCNIRTPNQGPTLACKNTFGLSKQRPAMLMVVVGSASSDGSCCSPVLLTSPVGTWL